MKNEKLTMKNERKILHLPTSREPPPSKKEDNLIAIIKNDETVNQTTVEIKHETVEIIETMEIEHFQSKTSKSENGMIDILSYNTTTECLLL